MNKIKKYQIPSGPIYYSRTQTPENLSKAANKAGEWFLQGMGKVGEILNGIITSGATTDFGQTSPFVMSSMKERKAIQKGRQKTQDKVNEKIAQGMTWVSPLNYGTALVTGNGLNAKKGQEIVENWSPAWQAIGRAGELYVGPKAIKGVKATPKAVVNVAAKAGSRTAKKVVVAREINKTIKENRPNVSNRTVSTDRTVNGITGLPDIQYTLYNEFGEPIGQTNIGGATLGIVNRASKTSNRMVDGVYSKNKAHKVSEDTYNVAIEDILNNGGVGLESGWSLMSPQKTMAVTSKFPYTVIGQEFGNPVRLLIGTTKRAVPQRVQGNHYLEIKPKTQIKFNETTGEFEEIPIKETIQEPIIRTLSWDTAKFLSRKFSPVKLQQNPAYSKFVKDVMQGYRWGINKKLKPIEKKDFTSQLAGEKRISYGAESSIYNDANNPNQVLKVSRNSEALSPEKAITLGTKEVEARNSLPYNIPLNIEGYYTSEGMYYPVYSQKKVYVPQMDQPKIIDFDKSVNGMYSLEKPNINNILLENGIQGAKDFKLSNLGLLPDGTVMGIDLWKKGGKMNILELLKNGSGIHIKKKNRGKFTSYCGGKVTDECIQKGKNSSNPAIRKRATFADNARHFKHRLGGSIVEAFKLRRQILNSLNNMIND